MTWVHKQMAAGASPRVILQNMMPQDTIIPDDFDNLTLWKIIINLVAEPPRREKLPGINTLEDVVELIKKSSRIVVLTGAGVCDMYRVGINYSFSIKYKYNYSAYIQIQIQIYILRAILNQIQVNISESNTITNKSAKPGGRGYRKLNNC